MKKFYFLVAASLAVAASPAFAQTADYGDAPDGGTFGGAPLNFNSLMTNEGPRHTSAATSTFWIANNRFLLTPDMETDSRQVNQDIDNGQPFLFVVLLGIPAPAKVTVPISTSAAHLPSRVLYLNVAIDVDDDYDYDNTGDLNWIVRNRAFTVPADTTFGITSDWFGFGSNLLLFPVWLRATVTDAPVASGWNDGSTTNLYGDGETEDWFYTFGGGGPYPPPWIDPPSDPGDTTKMKKKKKPKKPSKNKCIKISYPRVVYVKCNRQKCFYIKVRNCDGVDVTDISFGFGFQAGLPLPGPPTIVGGPNPPDVKASKTAWFLVCVTGWPCNPSIEDRWARYSINIKYDPEGLYEEEVLEIEFGSHETPFRDSSFTPHLGLAPVDDTLDAPLWEAQEGTPFSKDLMAFTGRFDFGLRWITGDPLVLPKKLPPWMTLSSVPLASMDSTQWMVSGTPPMNAPGIDTVILTVTSDVPTDTVSMIKPRDFIFPMHTEMLNDPPSLDTTLPATVVATSGQTITQNLVASDPDITRGRSEMLFLDYFFVDPATDTVVEPPTLPTLVDNGDGTGTFSWTPTAADVGNYKLKIVVWDYAFEVDSSETDVTVVLGFDDPKVRQPALSQNVPNPFSDEAIVGFSIPAANDVRIEVLNMDGRVVQVLVDKHFTEGAHEIIWSSGSLPPGTYMYRMTAGETMLLRKGIILR